MKSSLALLLTCFLMSTQACTFDYSTFDRCNGVYCVLDSQCASGNCYAAICVSAGLPVWAIILIVVFSILFVLMLIRIIIICTRRRRAYYVQRGYPGGGYAATKTTTITTTTKPNDPSGTS